MRIDEHCLLGVKLVSLIIDVGASWKQMWTCLLKPQKLAFTNKVCLCLPTPTGLEAHDRPPKTWKSCHSTSNCSVIDNCLASQYTV